MICGGICRHAVSNPCRYAGTFIFLGLILLYGEFRTLVGMLEPFLYLEVTLHED